MEQLTPTQARQVWQRVRGTDSDPLPRLLTLEAEIRHTYHYLQNHSSLRDSRLLARLWEESRRFSAMLAGMCSLQELDFTVQAPPSIRGNGVGLLGRCYRSRMECLALLDALPEGLKHPGDMLRQQMAQHSLTLLELLGQLPRN